MDRGAWRATVHGVTKSQIQHSDQTTTFHKLLYTQRIIIKMMLANMYSIQGLISCVCVLKLSKLSSNPWSVCVSLSVMSSSLWPHGLQPTRLLYPWDFPDKSTGLVIPLMIQFIARLPIVSEARIASVATSSSIIYPVTDPRCFLRLAS